MHRQRRAGGPRCASARYTNRWGASDGRRIRAPGPRGPIISPARLAAISAGGEVRAPRPAARTHGRHLFVRVFRLVVSRAPWAARFRPAPSGHRRGFGDAHCVSTYSREGDVGDGLDPSPTSRGPGTPCRTRRLSNALLDDSRRSGERIHRRLYSGDRMSSGGEAYVSTPRHTAMSHRAAVRFAGISDRSGRYGVYL